MCLRWEYRGKKYRNNFDYVKLLYLFIVLLLDY